MFARTLAAAGSLVLLVGCTARTSPNELTADHPANPNAAAAPLPTPSATLAVAPAVRETDGQSHAGQHGNHSAHSGGAADHSHHHGTAGPATTPTATTGAGQAALYACPHHPEITSDKPDQRCPKCNMKLVRKDSPATGHGGHP